MFMEKETKELFLQEPIKKPSISYANLTLYIWRWSQPFGNNYWLDCKVFA